MAESSDIPTGSYTLTLGKSFEKSKKNDPKPAQFHTLRYDFKPGSVSNEAETYIAFGNSGDVHVSVPNDGDNMTVFKGAKKEAKPKECLLFFDRTTNTVRLEKITSNINVKKTRDLDPGTEQALKKGIERLRTTSVIGSPAASPEKPAQIAKSPPPESSSSSDSEGSSDSDKSNGDSSDDEDESALLEQMKQQAKPAVAPPTSYSMPTSFSTNSKDKGNSEKYGLALSESSEEDD